MHVNTYNRHIAYINSKTIGIEEANIKVAYGYFSGTNNHCNRLKVFGRCVVIGKLLSRTKRLAEIRFDALATTTSGSIVAYVRIGSNTLLDNTVQVSTDQCRSFTQNNIESRARLFRLRFSLFIYVGTLTLSVNLDVHFNVDVTTNMCIGIRRTGRKVTGVLGAITPTAGVTLSGGVTGNLLVSNKIVKLHCKASIFFYFRD